METCVISYTYCKPSEYHNRVPPEDRARRPAVYHTGGLRNIIHENLLDIAGHILKIIHGNLLNFIHGDMLITINGDVEYHTWRPGEQYTWKIVEYPTWEHGYYTGGHAEYHL
jgi:hypothetical protein